MHMWMFWGVAVLSLGRSGRCQTDPVRLVSQDGRTSSSLDEGHVINGGRLEIFINRQWGTVCDDLFSSNDATVACRQLRFAGAIGYNNAEDLGYSSASGPIWLDNLGCSSFDTALRECRHNGIGVHNCGHHEDVILSCRTGYSVRLSIFSYITSTVFSPSGRLEIYIGGRWGTVCDDGFSITSANVACWQMGFSGAVRWTSIGRQSQFPTASSSTDILLDEVRCRSNNTLLIACPHNAVGEHDCSHLEDVVVFCSTETTATIASTVGTTSITTGSSVNTPLAADTMSMTSSPAVTTGTTLPTAATSAVMHSTPSATHTTPSATHTTSSATHTTPSATHTTPSATHTTPSATHNTPSATHSTASLAAAGIWFTTSLATPATGTTSSLTVTVVIVVAVSATLFLCCVLICAIVAGLASSRRSRNLNTSTAQDCSSTTVTTSTITAYSQPTLSLYPGTPQQPQLLQPPAAGLCGDTIGILPPHHGYADTAVQPMEQGILLHNVPDNQPPPYPPQLQTLPLPYPVDDPAYLPSVGYSSAPAPYYSCDPDPDFAPSAPPLCA